jgi:hypothetical protein
MEVAKYALTFDRLPHMVSRGETKYFLEFAEAVAERWHDGQTEFNEGYFRSLVAKAIIFRNLDGLVGRSDWYKEDRAYKAQTVTYTIAWLAQHLLDRHGVEINLQLVWNDQRVPDELEEALLDLARQVASTLRDAPSSVKNIGEYTKQKICWDTVRQTSYSLIGDLDAVTIAQQDARDTQKEARKLHRADQEIELDVMILKLPPSVGIVSEFARTRRLLSPKSNAALSKIAKNKIALSASEKNALKNLFQRMRQDGFDFEKL